MPFDWLNSLFKTQKFLVSGNIAGNAICLTHFTPARLYHLRFVNRLLETFCALDIFCAFTENYFAYIAGVLSSF